jgi:hypothetical protein
MDNNTVFKKCKSIYGVICLIFFLISCVLIVIWINKSKKAKNKTEKKNLITQFIIPASICGIIFIIFGIISGIASYSKECINARFKLGKSLFK